MRMALDSLAGRLLLASALLLPLFLGAAGLYLNRSQRLGIETAVAERLQLQILTLLAEAEFDQVLHLPEQLLEARFNRPDSGLYALVTDSDGQLLWSSRSALTLELEASPLGLPTLETGGGHFERRNGNFQNDYLLQRLQATLSKVYAEKCVKMEIDTQTDSVFRGDARDLMELLGILMDNACKYGQQRVRVTASSGGSKPLVIIVEDDGQGIPPELHQAVLKRGMRVDRQQSGHGIGLAVAADLVDSYLGTLQVEESELGGARLRVVLP